MSRRHAGRRAIRAGSGILLLFTLMAILSPLLATDRPLVARTAEGLEFPAFAAWPEALIERAPAPAPPREEVTFAILAPVPHSPAAIDLRARLLPPSAAHPFGTDELGRDLLARVIHGTRISLLVGFSAAFFSLAIGVLLGALAGYLGGWVDALVLRTLEVVVAFPFLVLLLALIAIARPGVWTVITALAITSWTAEARIVRGETLRIREADYAAAARASGAGTARILARHLLPNAIAPVLVSVSFGVSAAILVESAISFLGFGVPLPFASWGSILSTADDYLRQAWWLALFPGIAIFLTVAGCNLLGEGLRERLDPRAMPETTGA
ncbi:MAG: ABC transporter permease [Thermoanaerobaculia bacterium]